MPEAAKDVQLNPKMLILTVAVTLLTLVTTYKLVLSDQFSKDQMSIALVSLASLYYILYIKYQVYPLIS